MGKEDESDGEREDESDVTFHRPMT
ncbi:uncharacterized protein G2W53_041305 [Senna tora]|uniref:Uncharacterized protein n=1 Tax=Senna tora TaxID=362788 RepID=A0A834SEZ2_9FABA|nr:uncharacterized protein G2W53_041305 [Senna tora]